MLLKACEGKPVPLPKSKPVPVQKKQTVRVKEELGADLGILNLWRLSLASFNPDM